MRTKTEMYFEKFNDKMMYPLIFIKGKQNNQFDEEEKLSILFSYYYDIGIDVDKFCELMKIKKVTTKDITCLGKILTVITLSLVGKAIIGAYRNET